MPFRGEYWASTLDPEIDGDTVKVIIPTGQRTITIRASRASARKFANKLIRLLNDADRDQQTRIEAFKRGELDETG